jgi:hypothetical protein
MLHVRQATQAADPRNTFTQEQERARVREHLQNVELALRQQPVPHLSAEQRAARHHHLDELRAYWERGRFPRNFDHPGEQRPCFIDREGHVCAVAHLLIASRQESLAEQVAATANDAYVPEIDAPAFDSWMAESGLTRDELARIQPSYFFERPLIAQRDSLIWTLLINGSVALIITIVNLLGEQKEQIGWAGRIRHLLGILAGTIMFYHFAFLTSLHFQIARFYTATHVMGINQDWQELLHPQIPHNSPQYIASWSHSLELNHHKGYIVISLLLGVVTLVGARRSISDILKRFRGGT